MTHRSGTIRMLNSLKFNDTDFFCFLRSWIFEQKKSKFRPKNSQNFGQKKVKILAKRKSKFWSKIRKKNQDFLVKNLRSALPILCVKVKFLFVKFLELKTSFRSYCFFYYEYISIEYFFAKIIPTQGLTSFCGHQYNFTYF